MMEVAQAIGLARAGRRWQDDGPKARATRRLNFRNNLLEAAPPLSKMRPVTSSADRQREYSQLRERLLRLILKIEARRQLRVRV
jgi:hypothetical protein